MEYKNFGQSPAHHVVNDLYTPLVIIGGPTLSQYKEQGQLGKGYTLAPGQDNTTTTFVSLDDTVGGRKALEGGASQMYVHGRISYVDAFNQARFTDYCLRLHVNPGGLADTDAFVLCKDGNESD